MKYQWKSLEQISPLLQKAVMASEDQKFLLHQGFDFDQIEQAIEEREHNRGSRGASTITMQTARNLFLWQGHSWVRKAIEAYYTLLLELLWGKARIMEVYLNIIEWGKGIFGAEAAAHQYFNCTASEINRSQAALMAAVLPNPRRWSPASPTSYLLKRKNFILSYMDTFLPVTNKSLTNGKNGLFFLMKNK